MNFENQNLFERKGSKSEAESDILVGEEKIDPTIEDTNEEQEKRLADALLQEREIELSALAAEKKDKTEQNRSIITDEEREALYSGENKDDNYSDLGPQRGHR